jgi:hypothetical protein
MIHITVLLPGPSDLFMLLLISEPGCSHRFFFCFLGVQKEPCYGPLPIFFGTRRTSQHKSLNMAPDPKIEACFVMWGLWPHPLQLMLVHWKLNNGQTKWEEKMWCYWELCRDHIEDLRSTFETSWEHFQNLREQTGSTRPQIQKRKT